VQPKSGKNEPDPEGKKTAEREQRLTLDQTTLLGPKMAHALQHSTRRQILRALQRHGVATSPIEVLKESAPQVPLSHIVYHMRELEKAGLVEHVKTERVRGSTNNLFVLVDSAASAAIHEVLRQKADADESCYSA
jgi:hypothetical protein